MPQFSLIVATKGRTSELARFLESAASQQTCDYEIIIVDQNNDERLDELIHKWTMQQKGEQDSSGKPHNKILHLRSSPGLSRARNLGLAHCSGRILAFPDDDCWYPSDILQRVNEWFQEHVDYDILTVGSRDENGQVSGNRWNGKDCDLSSINIFRTSVSYSMFIRRPEPSVLLHFDEKFGLGSGTTFGSGEDTDFLLTLMNHGLRGRFLPDLHVIHPVKGYLDKERAAKYGGGWGGVLAKHSLWLLAGGFVTFDFARAVLRLATGDQWGGSLLWAHAIGIARAYFLKSREIKGIKHACRG